MLIREEWEREQEKLKEAEEAKKKEQEEKKKRQVCDVAMFLWKMQLAGIAVISVIISSMFLLNKYCVLNFRKI